MPAVMLQGTGSDVGKSLLVAGLCRAAHRRGLSVRPFKPQNMSNNAAVTEDGGEIGRAQALQARACGVVPVIDMNPVLLKPESGTGAQVILHGQRLCHATARDYAALKPRLLSGVVESFRRLEAEADLVIVEGAGSPAEINLRAGDIANMGFARAVDVPVVIVGDIDRGGVIAQLVGTHAVIAREDAAMVSGFVINKFRGDVSLFDDGYAEIIRRTGWRGFGVVPWFPEAARLPAEDSMGLQRTDATADGKVRIAVLCLPRIANFDDFDPLVAEPGVSLRMIPPGQPIPGDADLVILPGTKSTCGDLAALKQNGWDIDLAAHHRRGGHVLGICGGYQMLGRCVADPEGLEGPPGVIDGLGLLDIETVMRPEKSLRYVTGTDLGTGETIHGYEIHLGETVGPDCARPVVDMAGRHAGARSADGRITGHYLHGVFAADAFRSAWLQDLGGRASGLAHDVMIESTLDGLADHLETHLDVVHLLSLSGASPRTARLRG